MEHLPLLSIFTIIVSFLPQCIMALLQGSSAATCRRVRPTYQRHADSRTAWSLTFPDGRATGVYVDPGGTVSEIEKWLDCNKEFLAPDWLGDTLPEGLERPAPLIISGLIKVRQSGHLGAACQLP